MSDSGQLRRELGVVDAMWLGLGSIVGTGVFVSIGLGAGIAGPSVLLAIGIAALVAICNGLSSAQLAANHPVSGGTYAYGRRWLSPLWGFIAGWMFLAAKSASAATAALGFAAYLQRALGWSEKSVLIGVAATVVVVLTAVTLAGIRRSNTVNTVIVAVTLVALVGFIIAGAARGEMELSSRMRPFWPQSGAAGFLQATALMFVAYTGYGRIATLGEEVKEPRRTIPIAVFVTLLVSMSLYFGVALVAILLAGAEEFAAATDRDIAALQIIAESANLPVAATLLTIGAVTAMAGVVLNLILGLSRVVLAMGRTGDLPAVTARVSQNAGAPWVATIVVAVIILGLMLIGDVHRTWSFSAFTVLIYYGITNWCALRLKPEQRLFPAWTSALGLASCLFLAYWVDWKTWIAGSAVLGVGVVWKYIRGERSSDESS